MSEDTLLDAFVKLDVRGQGESKEAIDQFLIAAKKAFGDAGDTQAKAANKGANAQVAAAQRSANAIAKSAQASATAQIQSHALAQNAFLKGATVQQKAIGGLSNNAYQLGQAFEDAAVGFSLNGIQGAFRGAANNVSFLINNLAQAGTLTSILGAKTAAMLPLYIGIGTAALFVLPVLFDWIRALNEVDAKALDLADDFEREFSDIRFKVSLILDAQESLKAVQDAKDATEAIEEVIKQAQEGDRLRFKLAFELDLASESKVIQDFEKISGELGEAIATSIKNVTESIRIDLGDTLAFEDVDIASDPAVRALVNMESALETFNVARKMAFDDSAEGIVNVGAISTARDALLFLIDGLQGVIDNGNLTAEQMDSVRSSLEAAQKEFEQFNEEAQKLEQISDSLLGPILESAVESSKKLSRELLFQQAINQGLIDEEDRILFTMQEQEAALKRNNDELEKMFGNTQAIQDIQANSEAALQKQHEIELTQEIRDLEENIADARKDANKAAESAAKRRLELEKRIAKEEIDGKQEVANAEGELQAEIQRQAGTAAEERIQDQIQALQDAGEGLQSQKSQLGDTGQTVFTDTDSNKEKIKALQKELEDLRDQKKIVADAARIQELQDRIVQERKEAAEKLNDLRDDLEDAKKGEIEALNEVAEEINKMTEQLRQLREALQKNAQGENTTLPGDLPVNNNPAEPVDIEEVIKAIDVTFLEDQLADLQERIANPNNWGVVEILREEEARKKEQIRIAKEGVSPEAIAEARAIGEENIRRAKEAMLPPDDPIPDIPTKPGFAPEDPMPGDFANAQAQANARAMENTNFTSTTLQTLIATSNEILGKLNENVTKLDTSSRFS